MEDIFFGLFIGLLFGGVIGYQLGKYLFLRLLFSAFPQEARELYKKLEHRVLAKESEKKAMSLYRMMQKSPKERTFSEEVDHS